MAEKNNAGRRTTKAQVRAFLAPYDPAVRSIALKARDLVFALAPGILEDIDEPARMLGYCLDRTYKGTLCVIMPLKAGVNLGFARGADLPDPARLLTGTGKRARHVRLSDVRDVDSPAVRALLKAAVRQLKDR
jgi:hypothetical protein